MLDHAASSEDPSDRESDSHVEVGRNGDDAPRQRVAGPRRGPGRAPADQLARPAGPSGARAVLRRAGGLVLRAGPVVAPRSGGLAPGSLQAPVRRRRALGSGGRAPGAPAAALLPRHGPARRHAGGRRPRAVRRPAGARAMAGRVRRPPRLPRRLPGVPARLPGPTHEPVLPRGPGRPVLRRRPGAPAAPAAAVRRPRPSDRGARALGGPHRGARRADRAGGRTDTPRERGARPARLRVHRAGDRTPLAGRRAHGAEAPPADLSQARGGRPSGRRPARAVHGPAAGPVEYVRIPPLCVRSQAWAQWCSRAWTRDHHTREDPCSPPRT